MKKKIALIYDSPIPKEEFKTANDRRVYNIHKALSCSRNNAIIIHPNWRVQNKINDCSFIVTLGNSYFFNFLNRISFYLKTWQYIIKNKFEIVIFYNTIWDSSLLMFMLRISNIKFGMEICDMHSMNKITKSGVSNLINRYLIILPSEYILNKITDFNIVISKSIQNAITQNSPTLILPVLVDNDYFKNSDKNIPILKTKKETS